MPTMLASLLLTLTLLLGACLPSWALGPNILEDPGFEGGGPRVLDSHWGWQATGQPWGAEEDGAVSIVSGVARTGNQSASMVVSGQSVLWQRFPTPPNTDYTATCWIKGDPALGLGGDGPSFSIRRTDVICPIEICDDDGDEDLDHSEAIAHLDLVIATANWTPFTVTFNSGPYTQLAIHVYSVLSGSQYLYVDDCSVQQVSPMIVPPQHLRVGP